ncbi:MAG: hypothetical protein GY801_10450, partial [bacterium]|nr:hypothetical protein [bacterium]
MPIEITQKIEKYNAFWERTNSTPLTGYSIGSYFISKRFEAAGELLAENQKIEPDMLDVAAFQDDYVRMAEQWSRVEHDIVFTGTPFPGIPWMEAMLGCEVYSTGSSFTAHPTGENLNEVDLRHIVRNAWFEKYLEFTQILQELGNETFPVGQPILRGPTDIVGTILDQTNLVFAFYDAPEKVVQLLHDSVDRFLEVLQEQKKRIHRFYGGYA